MPLSAILIILTPSIFYQLDILELIWILFIQPDEFEEVRSALEADAKKENIAETPDAMFRFLIDRVRSNLHVVLCMSPVGDAFR